MASNNSNNADNIRKKVSSSVKSNNDRQSPQFSTKSAASTPLTTLNNGESTASSNNGANGDSEMSVLGGSGASSTTTTNKSYVKFKKGHQQPSPTSTTPNRGYFQLNRNSMPIPASPISTPPIQDHRSRLSPPPVRIIPEIFQDYNEMGYIQSLRELDTALDDGCSVIVIEPPKLADETERWISLGNYLRAYSASCAAITSIGAVCGPRYWFIWTPVLATGLITFGTYSINWQGDPAAKYQIERDQSRLSALDLSTVNGNGTGNDGGNGGNNMNSKSMLVLTRVGDEMFWINAAHSAAVGIAVISVGYRLFRALTD